MNVSLTNQLESYVQQKVATGMYNSASEVIREALRLMAEKDSEQSLKLEALRADIQKGVNSIAAGQSKVFDPEQIKVRARLAQQG
ncbi:MAG TPA: type II toxin-antitoxin system ParD family antitoxin [Cellvibrio sp.]|nr:type II toxin-antitoxin system ParD family antitoxin [Cellvibrio sp.]